MLKVEALVTIFESSLKNLKSGQVTESQADGILINSVLTYLTCTNRSLEDVTVALNEHGFVQASIKKEEG